MHHCLAIWIVGPVSCNFHPSLSTHHTDLKNLTQVPGFSALPCQATMQTLLLCIIVFFLLPECTTSYSFIHKKAVALYPNLQYSQNISLLYYIRKLCISWTNVFVSGKDKCICRELGQMQLQHWLCSPAWMDGQIDRLGKVKLGNKCNATHWKNTNDLGSYKGLDAGLERNEDSTKSKGQCVGWFIRGAGESNQLVHTSITSPIYREG